MSGRVRRLLLALVVALALAGSAAVLTQSHESRQAADFTFYYSAAVLVREGRPAAAYDQPALSAVIQQAAPQSAVDRRLPFNLPVGAVLPIVPLTLLPLDLAFRAWQLLGAGMLLAVVLVLARAFPIGRRSLRFALPGMLASVPCWSVLTEGQVTPLVLLGGALLLAALRFNAMLLAFGGGLLLAVKPHFLPVYLLVLVAGRRWRSLLLATAGAALMLLSPLALGGPGALEAMGRNALSTNSVVPARLNEAIVGLAATVLPGAAATILSLAIFIAVLLVLGALALRCSAANVVPFAALALWLGMLASPHVLPHDLLLLAAPAWLGFLLYKQRRLPSPLPALLLLELALLIDLRGVGLVLGPIAIAAAAAWAISCFRRPVVQPLAREASSAA